MLAIKNYLAISTLFLAVSWIQPATAQDEDDAVGELDEIIVTGTSRKDRTAMQTSYGVDVMTRAEITREGSLGITDLLDAVPGLFTEPSGGEVNANMAPRGLRGGFNRFISLQTDGLPNLYSPFLSEFEHRVDLTIDRVETTLGGPSGILTAQGAGAIVNFMTRLPTESETQARISLTDYGLFKTELFAGGPVNGREDLLYAVGGYYNRGDDIRDQGIPGHRGGQFRAKVKKIFDRSDVSVAFKHLDVVTPFYSPMPLDLTGSTPRPIAGFNARDSALAGPETRFLSPKTPGGIVEDTDISRGSDARTDEFSLEINYEIRDNLTLHNHTRAAKIHHISQDLRGEGNDGIKDATEFLASDGRIVGPGGLLDYFGADSARLVYATTGEVINPASLNGNGLLVQPKIILFDQVYDSLINKFEVVHSTDRNTATFGMLYFDITMDVAERDNRLLTEVAPRARLLDVEALDVSGNVIGHLTDQGVLDYQSTWVNGATDIQSTSFYINDEFQATDRLSLDVGVRFEDVTYRGAAENLVSNGAIPDPLNDPLVMADDFAVNSGAGTFIYGETNLDDVAWTIGGNFQINDSMAMYARYSDAFDMGIPDFAAFCVGGPQWCFAGSPTKLEFVELGLRYRSDNLAFFVTAYQSTNKDIGVSTGGTNTDFLTVDNEATGLEFQGTWRPSDVFSLELSGVLQSSELSNLRNTGGTGDPSFDGNQYDRLPNEQVRLTPTYHFDQGSAHVTLRYYGERFGDLANTQTLEAYTSIDAGVIWDLTDTMQLSVQARNLGDEFALTEGNPRGNNIVAGGAPFGYGRPILPRHFIASVTFGF